MKYSILLFISFIVISCTSYDKDDIRNDQSLYEDNLLKDYELFNLANEYISSNQLELALIELDKVEVLFPSSAYANKSMLIKAYIHFLEKDYEKTRAIAEMYKTYYPGSKDIVYANYLEAMTYYVMMKKKEYSQKNSNEALEKFEFILNAYPNSKYEIDIITKISLINNNLAFGKIKTAKYYLNNKNNTGALVYLLDIYENHSSSSSIEETLFFLTKIYYDIEEFELAKKYAAILAYNFPNSIWYKRSYNIINNITNSEENINWFESLNPIKLFKSKKVNDSKNNEIKSLE